MSTRYEPGAQVILSLGEEDKISAVVVHDNGGETVVVRYPHPHLDREADNVPVLRAFVSPAPAPADS